MTERDSVIGISASGRTPYVIGALRYAKEVGALTIGLFCNENKNVENIVDVMITPIVGPEVIMGSTRMKAGTAQKLVLNMISTGVMIKLGKVYSNLMVNLQASNEKLRERARRMVKLATGAKEDLIERVLNETNYNVKLAILMIVGDMEKEKAQKLLEMADGYIAEAIKLKDLVLQGEE
ncbi:MAG: N-acetylmuramic acid 6-phosphate etherase [Caldanaerobacter subterraneus]|nr:MAG: N-acetylmuramic acid 6-phosphate etherase [Caldanaerobacter subterraneus]